MVDWDWTGSCIPYTVRPSGRTVTTSAGGGKGEVLTGSAYVARPGRGGVGRPGGERLGQRAGQRFGQLVVGPELGGQHPGPLVGQVGGDLPGEPHSAVDLDAGPAVGHGR